MRRSEAALKAAQRAAHVGSWTWHIQTKERRQLEAQMQEAQKLESLGVLAGGIAHDFNNLLTAILGHANLALLQMAPDSPGCDNLREIENASRRAAELCRQMLAYAGRGRLVVEPVDLSRLGAGAAPPAARLDLQEGAAAAVSWRKTSRPSKPIRHRCDRS